MSLPATPAAVAPFRNIDELNAAHDALTEKLSELDDARALADEMLDFMHRAEAAGRLLYQDSERTAAQSLLNYWSAILYRAGVTPPSGDLQEFDVEAGEELAEADFPYSRLGRVTGTDMEQLKGWTRLTRECLTTLRKNHLLMVLGGSGSGRSSLVLHGVLPRLRAGGPEAGPQPCPEPFKPGTNPLAALARACGETDPARLRSDPAGSAARLGAAGPKTVLTVDDFEEVFALADDQERDAFLGALAAFADAGHFIIIILQSHFIGRLAHSPKLLALASEGSVTVAFETTELRQVIEVPARRVGLYFEEGVIDRLLRDVQGDPAALALLQFALGRLWQRRRRNWITLDAYRAVGGGRLALELAAEETFGQLSATEQTVAQQVFLRLIRPRLAGFITRAVPLETLRAETAEPALCDTVAERFIHASLLQKLPDTHALALTHESVVTHWLRLSEWVDVKRAEQRNRLLLESVSRQWLAQHRNAALLMRKPLVEEAESFEDLSRVELDFIAASRRMVRWKEAARAVAIVLILGLGALFLHARYAKEQAAKQARKVAAAQEKTRDGLVIAETLAARGTHLFADGRTSLGAVWLAEAFNSARQALTLMQDVNAQPTARQERLPEVHRQRVAMALRQVPYLAARVEHLKMSTAAVSPDGRTAITVSEKGAQLWDVFQETSSALETPSPIRDASFSADGHYFATAHDGGVLVWKATTREDGIQVWHTATLPKLRPTDGPVTAVIFDGRYAPAKVSDAAPASLAAIIAATPGRQGSVHVWPLENAEHPGWGLDETLPVHHVAFSPDRGRLAIALGEPGGSTGEAQIWTMKPARSDTEAVKNPLAFTRHDGPVRSVEFNPDGTRLLTACGDSEERPGFARVWDATTQLPLTTPLAHRRGVPMAQFSPTGARVLTASQDSTACVWDVASSRLLTTLQHEGGVYEARFSPDGRFAATGSRDRLAQVWDLASGRLLVPPLRSSNSVRRIQFTDDGRHVVSYGRDALRVWDLEPVTPPPPLLEMDNSVRYAAISANGERVVTAADGSNLRLWALQHPSGGKKLTAFEQTSKGLSVNVGEDNLDVTAVALSADGKRTLAGLRLRDGRSQLRVWQEVPQATGKPNIERILDVVLDGEITFAVFGNQNPDRLLTLSTAADKSTLVHLIQLEKKGGDPVKIAVEGLVQFVGFDRKDERFVTCGGDEASGFAQVWNAATGQAVTGRFLHKESVVDASFGPDDLLVTASTDDSAAVWDLRQTGATLPAEESLAHLTQGHTADLTRALFSPDGRQVLTTSFDSTAVLWEGDWRKLRGNGAAPTFVGMAHGGPVVEAAFSTEGSLFVTTCVDGNARVWDTLTRELVAELPHQGDLRQAAFKPDGSAVFSLAFLGPIPPPATGASDSYAAPRNPGEPLRRIAQTRVWQIPTPPAAVAGAPVLNDALPRIAKSLAAEVVDAQARAQRIREDEVGQLWKPARGEYQMDYEPVTTASEWHAREAAICETEDRWFGAAWHLERALLGKPAKSSEIALHQRCAAAWFRLRIWAGAVEHSLAILAQDSKNADALGMLTQARIELSADADDVSQLEVAEEDCRKWAQVTPQAASPWLQLARIDADRARAATLTGDATGALALWQTAIQHLQEGLTKKGAKTPANDARLRLRLADAQIRAGLLPDYVATCRKSLENVPADPKGREAYLRQMSWPCALAPETLAKEEWIPLQKALEATLERKPEDVAARNNLGAVLYRTGDLDGAQETFEKSIASWETAGQWERRQPDDTGIPLNPEARFPGRPQDWVFLAMIHADTATSPETDPPLRQRAAAEAVLYFTEVKDFVSERRDTSERRTWNSVELEILLGEAQQRVDRAMTALKPAAPAAAPD
ncbi:MAG: hypothetical protein QOE70_1109 [Chthoniobacter sp.]|jgi:WD40 repeat protein/tetratricopeptide (TPR) repeat protein|nr:hypothetical protein [Chthoniobacter sp.]